MKLCSFYRDRWRLIDHLWIAVVPCGHMLRHRLARNLLWRPRRHSAVEARKWNHRNRSSSTNMLSKCFASSQYRRHHLDDHQSRQLSFATGLMLMVHRSMCMSDDDFGMIYEFVVNYFENHLSVQIFSADFLFCDDHYFALTFLSSFVIEAVCLGSHLQSELLS